MYGGLHSPEPVPSADVLGDVARAFTPRVEVLAPVTVLLDLQGLTRLWPDPRALGEAVLGAASERGLRCRAALAGTRAAALILATACPGLSVVRPGDERSTLAPLPLGALGLAPALAAQLARWGLRTLGDLAALPADGLAARLGPEGPRLRRLACGEDRSPLVATPSPLAFEGTLELDWSIEGLEPLSFVLARLLDPLCAHLRERGRRASALTLELRLADGGSHRRRLQPAAPSADARTWRTLLLLDLEAHPPGEAVLALAVRAEPTPARAVQFSLLDPAQPSPERLAETLARLQAWTGAGRGGAPELLDTHRPGAFAVRTFAPGSFRGGTTSPARKDPRPRLALRAFRPPLPARVTLRDGAPAFVSSSRVRGSVTDRAGPWRVSGGWWEASPDEGPGGWSREEWDVAVGGAVYRLFRDALREGWFVEGELD